MRRRKMERITKMVPPRFSPPPPPLALAAASAALGEPWQVQGDEEAADQEDNTAPTRSTARCYEPI
jgi:hypothetical protein